LRDALSEIIRSEARVEKLEKRWSESLRAPKARQVTAKKLLAYARWIEDTARFAEENHYPRTIEHIESEALSAQALRRWAAELKMGRKKARTPKRMTFGEWKAKLEEVMKNP
jgi:hypothetical protein